MNDNTERKNIVCKTKYVSSAIDLDVADFLYNELKNNIHWGDGIKSKHGFTRKACILSNDDPMFLELIPYISTCLKKLTKQKYLILGLYLNYYENGQMYTPNHVHKGTHQLVLSLGAERILKVNKTTFNMKNGDAIIFGSSTHGVPKTNTKLGRISIATFMIPI